MLLLLQQLMVVVLVDIVLGMRVVAIEIRLATVARPIVVFNGRLQCVGLDKHGVVQLGLGWAASPFRRIRVGFGIIIYRIAFSDRHIAAILFRVKVGKGDFFLFGSARNGSEFLYASLHDLQMLDDVLLVGSKAMGVRQARLGLGQFAVFHVDDAEVVQALDVDGVQLEDAFVALE
jgi:hypothetical protein